MRWHQRIFLCFLLFLTAGRVNTQSYMDTTIKPGYNYPTTQFNNIKVKSLYCDNGQFRSWNNQSSNIIVFDLNIYADNVNLLTDTLKPGDTLIFDSKLGESIRIGTLTIVYDSNYTASLINENGDYDGYETGNSLKLYENGKGKVITFLYVSTDEACTVNVQVWRDYIIEILDNHDNLLRLKVTKQ